MGYFSALLCVNGRLTTTLAGCSPHQHCLPRPSMVGTIQDVHTARESTEGSCMPFYFHFKWLPAEKIVWKGCEYVMFCFDFFFFKEMQAKLAAQKLAERLNIKMQSYNPEGEASRKYREVRDEDDDQSSGDEFWRCQWDVNLCLLSCHDPTSDFKTSIKIGVRHCRGKVFFKVTQR